MQPPGPGQKGPVFSGQQTGGPGDQQPPGGGVQGTVILGTSSSSTPVFPTFDTKKWEFGPKPGEEVKGKMAVPKLKEYKPELVQQSLLLPLQHAADFAQLKTDGLHYSHPAEVLGGLLKRMVELSAKEPMWVIVQNLEKSPLYQAYLSSGLVLLNDWNADTAKFDMSKEEFEAFTDFRHNLRNLGV